MLTRYNPSMRKLPSLKPLIAAAALLSVIPAAAGADAGDAVVGGASDSSGMVALPARNTAKANVTIDGKRIAYTASVGALDVKDTAGRAVGKMHFTAYMKDGEDHSVRPVSFVFNGGPGAAAVFLNLGAIGPKRLQFGAQGDGPSDAPRLQDNPGSWLDVTDLVFVDPIGTGYSRPLVGADKAKALFYGNSQDIDYISRFIYDWLAENDRLSSPKYLVGESHSGYRLPLVTRQLQTRVGVGITGLVLISPILDSAQEFYGDLSPMPWVVQLPTLAAIHLAREGELDEAHIRPVIDYARGDYLVDLMRGKSDPAALDRMTARVAQYTGLDPAYVRSSGARIDAYGYARTINRAKGLIGSSMDGNITVPDPFPYASASDWGDTLIDAMPAPVTSALLDYYATTFGWRPDARYFALNREVNSGWDLGKSGHFESFTALRAALAADPKLRVLIAHGWNDLSCPFTTSEILLDGLAPQFDRARARVVKYPGGHMFYGRNDSLLALHRDVAMLYEGR
jgi:carboxypeptidase C (cathepsin A)